jgi:hypothetical protein
MFSVSFPDRQTPAGAQPSQLTSLPSHQPE